MNRCLGLAAILLLASAGAVLADWPERPVKLVVPFDAGGSSDQVARTLPASIGDAGALGEPVTVVNVGGHTSIGARQVMEADPDGHTFPFIHLALMGGEARDALDFNWRDFRPVAAAGAFCLLPMVRKDSGIDTVAQLLAEARFAPDTLIFGASIGGNNRLAGVMMQESLPGARFRFAQIGGDTANFAAPTRAQIKATVLSGSEVLAFTRLPDGSENPDAQIRPLAHSGAARFSELPDVPTMREEGFEMTCCIKNRILAPKDTPAEAVAGLADAIGAAPATDRFRGFLAERGFTELFLAGEALQSDLDATWAAIEPVAQNAART